LCRIDYGKIKKISSQNSFNEQRGKTSESIAQVSLAKNTQPTIKNNKNNNPYVEKKTILNWK